MKTVIHSFCLGLLLWQNYTASLTHCSKGTYQSNDGCTQCPEGAYMPYSDHAHTECFDCTEITNYERELLITQCNSTHDAVIQCAEGYYRRLRRDPHDKEECWTCTDCVYPTHAARPCETYHDTVCCPGGNFDAVANKDGIFRCRERPWLCRPGEYFNMDMNVFECLPCPDNTFMSSENHTMTECWKCQNPSEAYLPLHAIIVQPCNRTHNAVIGCEEGYFMKQSMGHVKNSIGCSSCTRCNEADQLYEGRKCDHFHDTVCCPEPSMAVVDTANGWECLMPRTAAESTAAESTAAPDVTVCGEHQYLYINLSDNSAVCKTCQNGTYLDEWNHTKTVCKDCNHIYEQTVPPTCLMNNQHSADLETKDHKLFVMHIVLGAFIFLFVLALGGNCTLLWVHSKYKFKHTEDDFPGISCEYIDGFGTAPNIQINPCYSNASCSYVDDGAVQTTKLLDKTEEDEAFLKSEESGKTLPDKSVPQNLQEESIMTRQRRNASQITSTLPSSGHGSAMEL